PENTPENTYVIDLLSPTALSPGEFAAAAEHAGSISEVAKSVQFQLARAVTRRKFEPLQAALDPAADAWDSMMESLAGRI
ncbi:DUF1839 family protein, partial [Rhizobium johnstonii]|uniref:DUF1839 family protein n=1 Tax=Rhizobium johnstonii TaxID=3019933 RepID=UPI003F9C87B8